MCPLLLLTSRCQKHPHHNAATSVLYSKDGILLTIPSFVYKWESIVVAIQFDLAFISPQSVLKEVIIMLQISFSKVKSWFYMMVFSIGVLRDVRVLTSCLLSSELMVLLQTSTSATLGFCWSSFRVKKGLFFTFWNLTVAIFLLVCRNNSIFDLFTELYFFWHLEMLSVERYLVKWRVNYHITLGKFAFLIVPVMFENSIT